MANRDYTAVMFSGEKNPVFLEARITFDANGAAALDPNQTWGFCAVNPETVVFRGATTNSSTLVGTVSSFAGLYSGMTVTGSAGSLQAATVISSTDTALTLSLSKQAILTGADNTLFATGGRYRLQLGTVAGQKLDAYNKLLYVHHTWDESTGSAIGTATSIALAPSAPSMFIAQNNISVRTVPPTAATNSTDCSIAIQFGNGGLGSAFQAKVPAAGEAIRILFVLGNSTAK